MLDQNLIVGLVVLAVVALAVYMYFPRFKSGGLAGFEGFAGASTSTGVGGILTPASNPVLSGAQATQGSMALANPNVVKTPSAGSGSGSGSSSTDHFTDFANFGGDAGMGPVPMAPSQKPAGCFPREQLNPMDLLPSDPNSQWAQVNPTGAGDLQGKNFLAAGSLAGINTIGNSLRNANLQLRPDPPIPQVQVSPWNNPTISPDLERKDVFSI